MAKADWSPAQYERFAKERRAPFDDLVALVEPAPGGRVVDLGCGTGELTRELHGKVGAQTTLGVDASTAMLERAAAHAGGGVTFERADIADVCAREGERFDVVFSNAALHWLPDLLEAIRSAAGLVAPDGQLAVQVPQNFDHASHLTAADVAREPRFAAALAGHVRPDARVAPEAVAELLFELGFRGQRVRLEVYAHELAHARDVSAWVKGSLLVDYEKRLSPGDFVAFVERYEALLAERLGERAPYLYAFKRLLLRARRPRTVSA